MDRRAFLGALGLLVLPRAGQAQPEKVYRLGYLAGVSPAGRRPHEAFVQGLHDLGWAEGHNIVIDFRSADGRFARLAELAAELVQLGVDVIVASATPAAVAARSATSTIPIVICGTGDPVGFGLADSLARPGGNVTGLSYSVGLDTFGKGLELLKEALPRARRVAVLSNPANPAHAAATGNIKTVARQLGLQLHLLEAREPTQFDNVFTATSVDT